MAKGSLTEDRLLKRQREGRRRTVDMVNKRNEMPGQEDSRKRTEKGRNTETILPKMSWKDRMQEERESTQKG